LDFESTRLENDEKLLSQIDSIKTANNIQTLIPFAKAYLGMFYVIDKELAEEEKVKLLANDELADAVLLGFVASLNHKGLPSVEQIGHAKAQQSEYAEGYVVLAGLDIIAKKSLVEIKSLNLELIEKAIGFHFSNKSEHHDVWFEYIFAEQKETIVSAISKYWVAMLKNKTTFLPGQSLVFSEHLDVEITEHCVLPLLDNWKNCKVKTLVHLLSLAFQHSDTNDFLDVCETAFKNDQNLNEKTRLYWLASAFLISPDKYFSKLSSYVGRVKLKIMPLLDFIILIMRNEKETKTMLKAKTVVQLLRMIAPVFPPQHHVYGAIGALDINSKNVMMMFYSLALSKEKDADNEIKSLRKARVMKIYSAVIDNLLELRMRNSNSKNFSFPNFDEYIETLINDNCLQGRSNKFDIR
jgi:hypothetical protein